MPTYGRSEPVEVDGALADPGGFGDLGDGEFADAVVEHQLAGAVQDARLCASGA
jgi:hypothetical protein